MPNLSLDNQLDHNAKPIKVDDELTPLEVSTDKLLYHKTATDLHEVANKKYVDGIHDGSVRIGGGLTFTPLTPSTINKEAVTGTNVGGHRLSIQGGQSTGIGLGGDINLMVSPPGGGGSSVNGHTTILSVVGNGHIGIKALSKLFFDGVGATGDTFIAEVSANTLAFFANNIQNLTLDGVDAKIKTPLKLVEAANAVADDAGWGQVWVKNSVPNELYFTNDAGDDIQLTSGTSPTGEGAVKVANVTISQAEMNDLENTEKVIVAAPGSNNVVIPISTTFFVNRSSGTAQGNSVNLYLGVNGSTTISGSPGIWTYWKRFMYVEGGDRIFTLADGNYEVSQNLTGADNQPLTLKLSGAITNDSIDSMKVSVSYYIYDNS